MSSSAPPRRRSPRIEAIRLARSETPPRRRSSRIEALMLARSQSIQAGDSALPPLPTTEAKRRKKNKVFAPPSDEDKFLKLEKSLLPGIGNAIALTQISTRLSEGSLQMLSSVSSEVGVAWRQAMEDRLVFDARVLANSGDSCVIISDTRSLSYEDKDIPRAIFLYSLRNHTRYKLPPIAQFESGFPYDSECIALGGRVYVLGGTKKSSQISPQLSSKDVYVLDLAAPRAVQGQWKLCARMQEARANFRCGAKDGKIYVFGGTSGRRWVSGSEVYDPRVNSWSPITPMPSWNERKVDRLGLAKLREISLHDSVATGGEEIMVVRREPNFGPYHLMVYHPVTYTWEILSDNFRMFIIGPDADAVDFMAKGKLYSVSLDTIRVYDIEKNQKTQRYSCSFGSARQLLFRWPLCAVAVDNEIVALVERKKGLDRCLVRSIGFGSDVRNIAWEVLPCSFPLGYKHPSMCFFKL